MTYFCDGGGWNGTHSRWAITDKKSNVIMYAKVFGHDAVSNNIAEYSAVINAMIIANDGDVIVSDSQLVIRQLNGQYRCKAENLKPLYEAGRMILAWKKVTLQWTPREKNVAGRFLDRASTKNGKVV